MTYEELRTLEASYLSSSSSVCKQYGLVLKDLARAYQRWSKPALSDAMLLSDLARAYIEEQKREMMFVKDREDYKARIRFAAKFVIQPSSYIPVSKLIDALSGTDLSKATETIKNLPYYEQIRPEVLEMAIKKLSSFKAL